MTDEPRLDKLESLLRGVPPMHDVPPDVVQACMSAAFDDEPQRPPTRRPRAWRPRFWSSVAVAAVAVTVGAAIFYNSHGQSGQAGFGRVVELRSSGSASATVAIGPTASATESVRVSISGLPPAHGGHYYQMWVRTAGGTTPILAFNTSKSGLAALQFTSSAATRWVTCWITLETAGRPSQSTIVLHATSTIRAT
jgi:anti-sigma-K factor RskA